MKFNINELQKKNVDELRDLFCSIDKKETSITLKGVFFLSWYQIDTVSRALAWLPRHVSNITFYIDYYYELDTVTDGEEFRVIETGAKRTIGNALKGYILSLPKTINSLKFYEYSDRSHNDSTVCADLTDIVKDLPSHIECLDLGDLQFFPGITFEHNNAARDLYEMYDIPALLNNIPSSVKNFGIGNHWLGKAHSLDRKDIFSAVPSGLETLSLYGNEVGKLSDNAIDGFFYYLSKNIKILDLSNNELDQMPIQSLGFFLSKIPRNIKILILSRNKLFTIDPEDLAFVLSQLPSTLEELDIGENRLLEWDSNYLSLVLSALPPTITSLRICQNRNNSPQSFRIEEPPLSRQELSDRFDCLPKTIKRLNFSNCRLGLSMNDFVILLDNLPKTIEEIDLGMNDFHEFPLEELGYLLSKLPSQIRLLKLNGNKIGTMNLVNLKYILGLLSPGVSELDVSRTGLDRLSYADIRAVWSYLPNTVKILFTEGHEFLLNNDGALVPGINLSETGLFNTQKRFHHLQEFAKWRLLMMQWVLSGQLNVNFVCIIFSYVIENMDNHGYTYMCQKLSQLIISSVPPKRIKNADEIRCLDAVTSRIRLLKPDDNYLDLSRCGLNRLRSPKMRKSFIDKLIELPQPINYLNLRGNGFSQNEQSEQIFIKLLRRLPKKIDHLDLSDNDFESKSAEKLEELFNSMFGKVKYVSLGNEKPISPELQIGMRKWPESYYKIASGIKDHMELALKFLNDYTKDDSLFLRIICGHFSRHYTAEAVRLVDYINRGLIPKEDIFFELEQIKPANLIGSFAKRQSFIFYHPIPEIIKKNQTVDLGDVVLENYTCQKRA